MTNTELMISELENVEYITREQAASLAKTAFTDYSRRSKIAKQLDRAVWDMVLAGGCPNAVRGLAVKLSEKYRK